MMFLIYQIHDGHPAGDGHAETRHAGTGHAGNDLHIHGLSVCVWGTVE